MKFEELADFETVLFIASPRHLTSPLLFHTSVMSIAEATEKKHATIAGICVKRQINIHSHIGVYILEQRGNLLGIGHFHIGTGRVAISQA